MAMLDFKGKTFVQNYYMSVKYHQLIPVKEKSLTDKVSLNDNLIIHGDNLKALKALLPNYADKVKCIYIDPPYNTGNENWVYNDNVNSPMMKEWLGKVVDKEDLTRHDKWLCMMTPRLKLLKELLSEDGVIFISIDDNEVHHLRMLMDEIFGLENFIGNFIVNTTPNARDYGHIGKMHEYCIFYAKNYLALETNLIEDEEKSFKYSDEKGDFNIHPLYNSNVAFTPENRPNLYYPFYLYKDKIIDECFYEIGLEPRKNSIEIFPSKSVKDNVQFVWRWGKEKSANELNKEIIGYKTGEGEYRIVQKMRTSAKIIRSILSEKDYTSRRGTSEVEELFQKKSFTFPKPVELIKAFVKISTNPDSIILDSFAGSGTTAQAVLDLNKEDGGNRKFILIECEDYADSITAERVRRVIKGVPNAKNEKLKEGLGGTFSYFELGEPIDIEKLLKGDVLPPHLELARYVFYTATGEEFDSTKIDENTGFIGESQDYEVYLFYKPDIDYLKTTALTLDRAKSFGPYRGKKRLVFAPMRYLDQEYLTKYYLEYCQLPYEIYKSR